MHKESIQLGPVQLQVRSFKEILDLYVNTIGLKVVNQTEDKILLGDSNSQILEITQDLNLKTPLVNSVGLYHIAIVFPTQVRLAKIILKIFNNYPDLFEGSADHLATEAFYFHDSIGNGIELYYDKPREEWPMENGKPAMGSEYIDPRDFLQNHINEIDNTEPLKVGHIHLKVSNIKKAKDFYVDVLKFDEIFNMPSALFVSYDNYHHHFGLNIWQSNGAPNLDTTSEGIKGYTITYLDELLFSSVINNIKKLNIDLTQKEDVYMVMDPFGIELTIKVVK